MRRTTTPEEWSMHLAAQPAGGTPVKSYCRENKLDLSSFYRHRGKRRKSDGQGEPQAFVLAPAVRPGKASGSSLSIRVKDFNLTLEPGYRPDDLGGVLMALAKVQHVLGGE